jgi:hypothetical protein
MPLPLWGDVAGRVAGCDLPADFQPQAFPLFWATGCMMDKCSGLLLFFRVYLTINESLRCKLIDRLYSLYSYRFLIEGEEI